MMQFWKESEQNARLIKTMKPSNNTESNPIKRYVKSALKKVYREDMSLIEREASERAIVFRFGLYLYEILKSTEFKDYDVDVEYNRNGYDPKRISSHSQNGIVPDLIIHKREVNTDNVLVLEFKTYWNSNQTDDVDKIQKLMDLSGEYKFQYGATILIKRDRPYIKWILRKQLQNKVGEYRKVE